MAMQMDEAGGAMLRHKIENLGVCVQTSKNTREIITGENCLNKM
jgi:nitrite reductase (NADH) large subunit